LKDADRMNEWLQASLPEDAQGGQAVRLAAHFP
jgi:hypothetical protein